VWATRDSVPASAVRMKTRPPPLRLLSALLLSSAALLALLAATRQAVAESAPSSEAPRTVLCAPPLTELPGQACAFEPAPAKKSAEPNVLVIFLHGLMSNTPEARHDWQLYVHSMAKQHGFALLVPHGRPGIGPGRNPQILAWPTSEKMRAAHEDAVLQTWQAAQASFEQQRGAKFERTYVFGFSNGAYYATSLLVRAKLKIQGYAMFGGGSAASYLEKAAKRAALRPRVFVGVGKHDRARKDAASLALMLKRLGWKHRLAIANGGHSVTPTQVKEALGFLGGGD